MDITKWQPADIIRLVALIGAFILAIGGAVMMWLGISADGAIDVKSTVISGSIKTGMLVFSYYSLPLPSLFMCLHH